MNKIFSNIVRFLLVIIVQIFLLDHLLLGGYINPCIYILFILLLPIELSQWAVLLISFFTGLIVDSFSDSMGLHAASSTMIAYLRPYLLKLLAPRDVLSFEDSISTDSVVFRRFLSYCFIMVFLHHLVLYYLEVFSFREFFQTFYRVLLSSIVSVFLIVVSHLLFQRKVGR